MLIDNEAITLTFGNVSLAWPILIPLLRRAALPPFAPFPRVKSPSVPFLYAPIFLPRMILPPLFCQQSNTGGSAIERAPLPQLRAVNPLFVSIRACFKNRLGKGLRARRGGWRGARREHIREKSVTDEQKSHPPPPAARPTGIFSKHALRRR